MGLFDKVRQVFARVVRGRSDTGRRSGETGSPGDRPAASQEHLPSPGTAQPAQALSAVVPEPEPPVTEVGAAEVAGQGDDAADAAGAGTADTPAEEVPDETGADERPAGQSPKRYRTYTIRPGQTLAEVAALHEVNVQRVAELNGLDPELIFAGQVVRIPHA